MAALEAQQQPASDTPMEAAAPPEMPWWMQTPSVQRLLEEYDSKTDAERAEIKRRAEEAEEEADEEEADEEESEESEESDEEAEELDEEEDEEEEE